jgi:citrate lyase beta subunit
MNDLRTANRAFAATRPGEREQRQPVHTVYGGAQLFKHDIARRLGAVASSAQELYAPAAADLAEALGWESDGDLTNRVFSRVHARLRAQPVEDFRIDFEDGYGNRTGEEEDHHARVAGAELAKGLAEDVLPPFIGLRIKPLNEELRARSERTLGIVLETLLRESDGRLPSEFVVTLPKITVVAQVEHFVTVLSALEQRLQLSPRALRFEIMVETPQIIIDGEGRCPLPAIILAGDGRITGAHFGTYDYTAGLGITAAQQKMQHPACDHAKHVMQVALAGTGVFLSDGSTAVLPAPSVRAEGRALTPEEQQQNRRGVHHAWRLHYDDVMHSLGGGFYQGWDLHPAQLVTRYAAVYRFFLEGLDPAGARLRNFVDKAAQATLLGDVFDDAATGQGLLNYFVRAINCGAVTEQETIERTGLTLDELQSRSFSAILRRRTAR